ncbi:alpha/beta hydrolase [Raineyella sp. LH-20]|uniref:alpha/beta fold hydrolase n=1 Tax=Raineyella sp. LH-20 TaxID=3081204 RepID=UPI002952B66A|nr:alpha/beta hydrolase [Raineyella sp. LH-20]WOP20071.1 alpha/beta hydrolase [Raineyella sp. LH-20]
MARWNLTDHTTGEPVSLAYDDEGEGPAVVQLHGLTSSRARDRLLGLDIIAGLTDHRLIHYDARGHGHSTGPRIPGAYAWPRLAEDLLDLLDHLIPDEPVHAVGKSMGVGTLLHAAVRRPERFSGLTLIIPPTAWASRVAQHDAYVRNADLIERRGLRHWSSLEKRLPLPPAVRPDRPFTLPDVAEDLLPTLYRGAAATDLPTVGELADLDLPTLILGWLDDPSHPLSTARTLHEVLPDSRLAIARTPADVATWPGRVADHVDAVAERGAAGVRGRR